jgi:hypothetical protein
MISSITLFSRAGDVIVQKIYRKQEFDLNAFMNFRTSVLQAKELNAPAVLVDQTSFLTLYLNEIYYVATTRNNSNAGTIFDILSRIPKLLLSVYKIEATPHNVRAFSPHIIELLDEIIDYGYMQCSEANILKVLTQQQNLPEASTKDSITIQATGVVSHRKAGIVHKNNEVYVDMQENVNLLAAANGKVIDSYVIGRIFINSQLSGMSECKIGFNDKISVESGSHAGKLRSSNSI